MDWRANRLADALATASAGDAPERRAILELLKSAETLVKHEAAILGAATAAAYSCEISFLDENGTCRRVVRRASTGARQPRRTTPDSVSGQGRMVALDREQVPAPLAHPIIDLVPWSAAGTGRMSAPERPRRPICYANGCFD